MRHRRTQVANGYTFVCLYEKLVVAVAFPLLTLEVVVRASCLLSWLLDLLSTRRSTPSCKAATWSYCGRSTPSRRRTCRDRRRQTLCRTPPCMPTSGARCVSLVLLSGDSDAASSTEVVDLRTVCLWRGRVTAIVQVGCNSGDLACISVWRLRRECWHLWWEQSVSYISCLSWFNTTRQKVNELAKHRPDLFSTSATQSDRNGVIPSRECTRFWTPHPPLVSRNTLRWALHLGQRLLDGVNAVKAAYSCAFTAALALPPPLLSRPPNLTPSLPRGHRSGAWYPTAPEACASSCATPSTRSESPPPPMWPTAREPAGPRSGGRSFSRPSCCPAWLSSWPSRWPTTPWSPASFTSSGAGSRRRCWGWSAPC